MSKNSPNWRNIRIVTLDMSTRATKGLARAGITKIGDLVDQTPRQLLRLRGIGELTLREIREMLRERGLRLRDDDFGQEPTPTSLQPRDLDRETAIAKLASIGGDREAKEVMRDYYLERGAVEQHMWRIRYKPTSKYISSCMRERERAIGVIHDRICLRTLSRNSNDYELVEYVVISLGPQQLSEREQKELNAYLTRR